MNDTTDQPGSEFAPLSPQAQKSAARSAYIAQCAGVVSHIIFVNGMMLLYFLGIGVSEPQALVLFAVMQIVRAVCLVPFAHIADTRGVKTVGIPGQVIVALGLAIVMAAGFTHGNTAFAISFVGVAVFGAGWAMYDCGWFALLSGFVPPEARGRFFGGLRFSWQLTSIAVTFLGAWALGESAATWVFQAFIGFVIAMQFLRLWVYTKKIPDRVHRVHPGPGLLANVMEVLRLPHFAPFCSYCFLLVLFTTVPPTLFTVIEKTFMKLGDDTVVMLSTTTMIGQLVGYMACGLIVDRLGTKPVFTLAHLGFAAALLLFPLRALTGDSILCLAALHMLYGVTFAASSVAMTAELFSLIPNKRKSLSAAIQLTLQGVGVGLSTMIPAACISLGFLKDRWTLLGSDVSAYDAILIGLGMLTLLMIVSLTLVPSVIGKSEEQVP